ncbi:2Fe-2S iron-sulfur cluster binding domain-containing protein [Segetibacter sp. 3557_3]|uniref:FAD binding domain-containing protein n=1 Tax=Segetibacter sp. 3557_3 TaxID=2547429 RepID=UPI0010590F86|nr:FAD binding domain-containing protein [Segetibacter sp. 3557_3]TDH25684.1 2Fe-2S iron-sulfur cluster binding domain-containing protein [Segetibacter sp. 3557_3]
MIHFLLNDKPIATSFEPRSLLLDFIRYHQNLVGTKVGCREGDCGACTVLVGTLKDNDLTYSSATSCLMPLGNADRKHIVTVEGINMTGLNGIQEAMASEGGTQCGFCTPGFVVSLAGFVLDPKPPSINRGIEHINGNICRCTGYKSIERATAKICGVLEKRNSAVPVGFAIEKGFLPGYFGGIADRLKQLPSPEQEGHFATPKFLGGGTDLYVQMPEVMQRANVRFLAKDQPAAIRQEGAKCIVSGTASVSDLINSPIFHSSFPEIFRFIKLVSSTPIRNMATIAGNFVNASPIGDLTIFFLALDAELRLTNGTTNRVVALKKFYRGYKLIEKEADEYIQSVEFNLPSPDHYFNFEKVSKRTHLDIASVNTAMLVELRDEKIQAAAISAGGVGPFPLYLEKASAYLVGKKPTSEALRMCIEVAQSEISPISDTRGSAPYKRLLLAQLINAHFMGLPQTAS